MKRPLTVVLACILLVTGIVAEPLPVRAALLDDLPGATFAFSLSRYLSTSFVGSAVVRLRENSGSTEQDFKLNGSNVLVTNDVNENTVAQWLTAHSATTAYVVSVYDQSGHGRTFTQTDTGSQPVFVQNSALNGLAAIDFSGSTGYQLKSASISITDENGIEVHAIVRPTTAISREGLVFANAASSLGLVGADTSGWQYQADFGDIMYASTVPQNGTNYQMSWRYLGSDQYVMDENGTEVFNGPSNVGNSDWRTGVHAIGNNGNAAPLVPSNARSWQGLIAEVIFYNGIYSSGNLSEIQSSQQAQAGINQTPPASSPARVLRLRGGLTLRGGIRLY